MSTAIATRISKEDVLAINEAAAECRTALVEAKDQELAGGLVAAASMQRLRDCLTPAVMASVAQLQGTRLGFLTDKQKTGGYAPEDLKDVVIEAALRGLRLVGNEINVIGGNCYGAQAGYLRLLKALPGVENFADVYEVMETNGRASKVQAIAVFTVHGQPRRVTRMRENAGDGQTFDNRLTVPCNAGMGPDAIEGKAKRRFYKYIYEKLTGISIPDGDVEGEDAPPRELVPMFAGGAVKEEAPPEDDGCPLMVAEYRSKFATVAERSEIGKTMAMAGRDARLTPKARKAVADFANEAQRIWPKRLDAETAPTTAPSTSPPPAQDGPTESECIELDFVEVLNRATTLADVLKIETDFAGHPKLDEDAVKRLIIKTTERREVIRGSRGPRAGAKTGGQTSFA